MKRIPRGLRYFCFALPGAIAGIVAMALGVFLASADNGWERALYYSAVGVVGAPLATLAWGTNKLWRAQVFSGVSVLAGIFATMAMLLEFTVQHATIVEALTRAPFAFASWLAIWIVWMSLAAVKLVLFEPAYTRRESLPR